LDTQGGGDFVDRLVPGIVHSKYFPLPGGEFLPDGTEEVAFKAGMLLCVGGGHLPDVQIDTEKVSAYTVEKSPVNYRF